MLANYSPRLLRSLVQRAYPMAQQAYQKWDQLPQSEKDQYITDVKDRAKQAVQTIGSRVQQSGAPSTSPSTPSSETKSNADTRLNADTDCRD